MLFCVVTLIAGKSIRIGEAIEDRSAPVRLEAPRYCPQERHQHSTCNSNQPQRSRNLRSNGDELIDKRSTAANHELRNVGPAMKSSLDRSGEDRLSALTRQSRCLGDR